MNFRPKAPPKDVLAKQPVEAIPSMKGKLNVVAPVKGKKKPKRTGGMGVQ